MHFAALKTKDYSGNLHQKIKTATTYARRVLGLGIDIEVLVQMQNFWYIAIQHFVIPKQLKVDNKYD